MGANKLFFGTMKFVWLKLAFNLVLGIAITLWVALCIAIIVAVDSGIFGLIVITVGIGGGISIYKFARSYIGYLIKAGHVAVIAEAAVTGIIPANQFEYGKAKVKSRFVATNVFFVIDHLVSGAVKQLQRVVGKVGDLLGGIPGFSVVVKIAQIFIEMALGYVDECCLGYTFNNPEQNAFKSSADGVVIYFQNWKELLKSAAKATAIFLILMVVVTLICFFPILALLGGSGEVATVVAILISLTIAASIKVAFVDSYLMIVMMEKFLKLSQTTEITFDLYGRLSNLSNKFKDLFSKGQEAQPVAPPQQTQSV